MIETGRLYLRPFETGDAQSLYHLNLDPLVLAFTGDVPFESVRQAQQFIKNYDQYRKYGVGRMAVIEKDKDAFIGWCGLKYSAGTNEYGPDEYDAGEYDIGFRFFQSHWSRGFATESARACIAHGFKELGVSSIVGRAMKDNLASIRVLEKIGLRFLKSFDFEGREGVIYCIDRQDYLQPAS